MPGVGGGGMRKSLQIVLKILLFNYKKLSCLKLLCLQTDEFSITCGSWNFDVYLWRSHRFQMSVLSASVFKNWVSDLSHPLSFPVCDLSWLFSTPWLTYVTEYPERCNLTGGFSVLTIYLWTDDGNTELNRVLLVVCVYLAIAKCC
jgi:hypothetical protein